ncbi:C45 family autoproteolytic acyltransferase/hydolase [Oceanobacillus polygoni]|uniref:Choloylglycine hydrolase n=1 Tax=Oceanobacillus polygoni TaxID=1235259 RepID=A0A9X0YR40_9BACI|nr:C45 family peptidase [Oceanobacillus polygoni]MBP2076372.1 putative choloylglycine hydrolase [Oceanobacillus polygoni]
MRTKKALNVEVVYLKGNAYEAGITQGINQKLDAMLQQLLLHVNVNNARKQLEMISPNFLRELTGLAAGMNIDLETAIRLYSGYDYLLPKMGCTSYSEGSFYVRNYDFNDEVYDARFVCINPDNGYASIGFSQHIVGRLDGMNEKGLVIGLHFVNEKGGKEGFLATTICRLVLNQCATNEEAIALIKKVPHQYCYNYSIMDKSGEQIIVEASPDDQIVHHISPLVCTNHFESTVLADKNRKMVEGSRIRKQVLQTLNGNNLTAMAAYRFFNDEESPLFFTNYQEYFGTLHTVVYCPQNLTAIIGVGGNCEPYMLSFNEWLSGDADLPDVMRGTISL